MFGISDSHRDRIRLDVMKSHLVKAEHVEISTIQSRARRNPNGKRLSLSKYDLGRRSRCIQDVSAVGVSIKPDSVIYIAYIGKYCRYHWLGMYARCG